MSARSAAVTLSLALTVAVSTWLLAQFALSADAGRDLTVIARQGARLLPLLQLFTIGLIAPWLYLAARDTRALSALLIFVLVPLPLLTLLVLAGGTPFGAAGIALASVAAWGLLVLGAAALIHRARAATVAPLGFMLVQAGATAIVWRAGSDWLHWAGTP